MRKPKFPKSKSLAALKRYEAKLKQYEEAKKLEARLRERRAKL
jgi:hypothetical protein